MLDLTHRPFILPAHRPTLDLPDDITTDADYERLLAGGTVLMLVAAAILLASITLPVDLNAATIWVIGLCFVGGIAAGGVAAIRALDRIITEWLA